MVACSAGSDTESETPGNTEIAVPITSNGAEEGYPGPDSGYPGPDQGVQTDPDTLRRPEQLTQFPGSIAFSSDRISASDVFILDGQTGLLDKFQSSAEAFEPAWTDDCQTIGITGKTGLNAFQLFAGDAFGGTESRALNTHTAAEPFDYGLAWSPDGQVIAFHRLTVPRVNICFANAATGELISCMENTDANNAMPAWSPDGSKLVFSSDRSGNYQIYIADYLDESNVLQLTNNNDLDYDPEFSPDGSRIVYSSRRGADFEIYVMNPDGTGEIQITDISSDDRSPTWVGNNQIAFSSNLTANYEIYLVDVASAPIQQLTTEHQLTYNLATDSDPAWCGTN